MAVELTLKGLEAVLRKRSQPVHIPAHVLVGAAAAIAGICLFGVLAGIHSAQRDRREAQARFADTQTLLALPPVSIRQLKADLDEAKAELSAAQARSTQSVDASSDVVIGQLVLQAQSTGVAVSGVSRLSPTTTKLGDATYDVHGVRVVTDGAPPQILAFLSGVQDQMPALFPTLLSMTINDAGIAHAEIAFNAYTKPATPTPPAAVATRSPAR